MPDQILKTILAALVNQIDTQTTNIAYTNYKPKFDAHQNMAPGKLPACIIYLGRSTTGHSITSTNEYNLIALVQIIVEPGTDDDTLYDYQKEVRDAINTDISLGATCITCLSTDDWAPSTFTSEQSKNVVLSYTIRYWEDFP